MKRVFATLILICWCVLSTQVIQSFAAEKDDQAELASPTVVGIKSEISRLLASSRRKTDARLAQRDESIIRSISDIKLDIANNSSSVDKKMDESMAKFDEKFGDIAKKVDDHMATLNSHFAGEDGEFEKITSQILSANKKTNRITAHLVGWMAFWIILIIIFVVGIATYFIKRQFSQFESRVGKGIKNIKRRAESIHIKTDATLVEIGALPAKTAEHVHAFFDRRPFEFTVAGHSIVFHQDEAVLDRRAYQILLVEPPITTAEKYVLQEVSKRDKAIDSLKRTMREYFNGVLAAKSDPASKLTLDLIEYYIGNKKLVIS